MDIKQTYNAVDYKALLKKYIDHVSYCEGVSFISDYHRSPRLSDEEWKELIKLDKEVYEEGMAELKRKYDKHNT